MLRLMIEIFYILMEPKKPAKYIREEVKITNQPLSDISDKNARVNIGVYFRETKEFIISQKDPKVVQFYTSIVLDHYADDNIILVALGKRQKLGGIRGTLKHSEEYFKL